MQNPTTYPTKNAPKATLLIVPGMAEHQGRYAEFAEFLASHDIAVMTFDHLGHGEMAKVKNCLGYFGNPNPHEWVIDNVMTYAKQLATQFPDIPHFIMGHSMGSFVVRCILQRFGQEFDGAIIMGTSASNPLVSLFLPITAKMNQLSPKKTNRFFYNVLGKVNNLPFRHEPNLDGLNWLNSDKHEVKKFIADPLCGFMFTNNGYFGLLSLMAEGTHKHWWRNVPKDLPMLLVSGEDDPVGQMGKGVPKIVKDLEKNDFADVKMIQYPKMRHEILLEKGKQQVFDDILNWLLGQT